MRAIRLPVPSMTLPAVLCFLVACHLGPTEMTYLLKDASEVLSNMPGFDLSQERQDALSYNCLAGDNWYRRP
jgi:transposase